MGTPEARWIEQAKAGDKDAFANLVDTYQKPVFSVCYRMLGTPTAAEDAAQETFIRAYQALDRYDPDRSIATWLLSIASNYSIDQLRKKKATILSMDNEKYAWLAPPSKSPNPEQAALEIEKQKMIHNMLSGLSETDRAAVILQYWHDCSYEEIAETLELTLSAVKSRLYRARRTMAEKWQEIQANAVPAKNPPAQRIAHETQTV